ncbi:MAG: hypothetical protein LUG24_05490, partial [Clostridiales bacterium]|nr:hypothetical protein [Clostridiales bacterium]
MEEDVFDINNLISEAVEEMLQDADLEGKVKILINLIDFRYNFSGEIVDDISEFYFNATQRRDYEPVPLGDEEKDFVYKYVKYFPDVNAAKRLINGLCNEHFKDSTLKKASEDIERLERENRQKIKEAETMLFENLVFDDDKPPEEKV